MSCISDVAQTINASLFRAMRVETHLLHNAGLTLREGDVSTRLVLDKLDLNLSPLTTWLVIVVVIIISGSGRGARTLDASVLSSIAQVILVGRGASRVLVSDFRSHDAEGRLKEVNTSSGRL